MKNILEWAKEIVIAVIIAAVILSFVKPIIVQQSSMEPTFHSGDYIFISKQAYTLFGELERGDVVVFHSSLVDDEDNEKNLIKRVIALPGETIEIIDGYVYIDGELLEEDYVKEAGLSGNMEAVTVPEGTFFAMGDNRGASQDSRDASLGCIDQSEIMGKVIFRLYPFDSIKIFS